MSLPSALRGLRLGSVVGSAATIVIVACGGSAQVEKTTVASDAGNGNPSTTSPGVDGSATTDDSGANTADSSVISAIEAGSACAATGNEVVMIGDSYLALSGEITSDLEATATTAGALAPNDDYRTYYADGANMYPYTTFPPPIPTQFQTAVSGNPDIKYVIMDGGGNDILVENNQCITVSPDAGPMSQECQTAVTNALTTAATLLATMQKAGVEKVIYFFYPDLPTTSYPSVNVMMDYAYPLVQKVCDDAPLPCYFIDTRPAFAGHPEYIGPDNIHPTSAGSAVIANLIWGVMKQECIALAP